MTNSDSDTGTQPHAAGEDSLPTRRFGWSDMFLSPDEDPLWNAAGSAA
ncbi:hypothetical protein FNQ90_19045 [Streptomyces alkaliphilus]|uniref:Uncharacterized protein n=1 Tax=Streptomyces alkaliphilus TaxID=1472722 RepID=A0A7W3Y363_9ACTN|nr:hypothetical protein [Streptomyces alkaliphilus]MBB0246146.1 hypothetical protein [Streptomyces alkaliphilus]